MKRSILSMMTVFAGLVLVNNVVNAQLDTAWMSTNHINQYIYPPLIDSSYERYDLGLITSNACGYDMAVVNGQMGSLVPKVAQRYEVQDSVKIIGVSMFVSYTPSMQGFDCDTVTLAIWDSTLTSTIYSKSFVVYGLDTTHSQYISGQFIEALFDDTITLYNDYYVSVETSYVICNNLGVQRFGTTVSFLFQEHYWTTMDYCTPYGCCTKYRPYVQWCLDDNLERPVFSLWVHVDNVNWYNGYSYSDRAKYPDVFSIGCDTTVYAPLGLCPIRALEPEAADTASGDTTSAIVAADLLDKAVSLYPNPAKEVLNIASDHNVLHITVYDALNRLVEEREVNAKTLQISLANYALGNYFVKIRTDKGTLTKKFVVR